MWHTANHRVLPLRGVIKRAWAATKLSCMGDQSRLITAVQDLNAMHSLWDHLESCDEALTTTRSVCADMYSCGDVDWPAGVVQSVRVSAFSLPDSPTSLLILRNVLLKTRG